MMMGEGFRPSLSVGGAQHTRYYLKFQNKIRGPLHTCKKVEGEAVEGEAIEGEAGSDVKIALFDNDKEVTVISGPLSSIKVEIVVLNGDFNNDGRETWSEEEFNKKIALPRDNKGQLLKGERFIKLNNGIGSLGDIKFTDNSSFQNTKNFRLGVRYAQSVPNGERIQEGITEPLRVKDRRVESRQKHDTPSLDDDVWRLKYISEGGKYHERLQGLGIKTVQDFLRYYNLDKGKLRNILGSRMSESCLKDIVNHAEKCDPGNKLHSFSIRENNVVLFFDSFYRLVGVKFGDCYTTLDNFDTTQKDSVESWKNLAYRNIKDMQFDHRMINGNPMPLLSSDVTFLPRSSSPPSHISTLQIINYDQVYSQVGLPQETSIEGKNSHDLFMKHTSIDLDNHQTEQYTSIAKTSNLPLEMGNSSFYNITTSEACYRTQPFSPGIEPLEQSRTTVKNQVESSPFVESLRVQPNFSRMNSVGGETSRSSSLMCSSESFERLIQTPIHNLPISSGGETSCSIAPPSPHPRFLSVDLQNEMSPSSRANRLLPSFHANRLDHVEESTRSIHEPLPTEPRGLGTVNNQTNQKRGPSENLNPEVPKRLCIDATMPLTSNVEKVPTRWAPRERLSTPTPSEGHDRVNSVDAEIVIANPQDAAPLQGFESSISSRHKPKVDYESSPTVGNDDPDSHQNALFANEDAFNINTTTFVRTLMENEYTDDDDDATATKGQEVESVDKGGHIAAAKDDGALEVPNISGPMSHPASSDQVIQENATQLCRTLSCIRFDVLNFEAQLQKLLEETKVIQEVAARPSYIYLARFLKTTEHMNLVTKELKDYDSKSRSLIQIKENTSALLNQQRHKVEDLEKTLAQEKVKEVELSGEVDAINNAILCLDLGKNEVVKKVKGVDEYEAAKDGHHAIE